MKPFGSRGRFREAKVASVNESHRCKLKRRQHGQTNKPRCLQDAQTCTLQRDAHPRRTTVTCGIPSKATQRNREMRTIKIIWVTVLQTFQTTEGRQGDRGRRWKKGGGFSELCPNSEQGGGVKMHGSIHQSIWEAKGWQAPAEALVRSWGEEGGLILEHQVPWSWRLVQESCMSSAHCNTDFLPMCAMVWVFFFWGGGGHTRF